MKHFNQFLKEFNMARVVKTEQEAQARAKHKADEQERIVHNIMLNLSSGIERVITDCKLEPVQAWEATHAFDCITKDDTKQIILGALQQIESELIKLSYKFEAHVGETVNGYELVITLNFDGVVTLSDIFSTLLDN